MVWFSPRWLMSVMWFFCWYVVCHRGSYWLFDAVCSSWFWYAVSVCDVILFAVQCVCVCVIVGINWCCLEIFVWFTVALGVSDVIWFGMRMIGAVMKSWFDLQLVSSMWFNFASQGKVRMLAILWLWCKLHVSRPILGWPCLLFVPFFLVCVVLKCVWFVLPFLLEWDFVWSPCIITVDFAQVE